MYYIENCKARYLKKLEYRIDYNSLSSLWFFSMSQNPEAQFLLTVLTDKATALVFHGNPQALLSLVLRYKH